MTAHELRDKLNTLLDENVSSSDIDVFATHTELDLISVVDVDVQCLDKDESEDPEYMLVLTTQEHL